MTLAHRVREAAQSHVQDHGHHTADLSGEGWMCESCDVDFQDWISSHSARKDEIAHFYPCDGVCVGGVWHGAGYVENGVFKGHTGPCFRCRGKGHQTDADVKRNRYYDNNVRRIPTH